VLIYTLMKHGPQYLLQLRDHISHHIPNTIFSLPFQLPVNYSSQSHSYHTQDQWSTAANEIATVFQQLCFLQKPVYQMLVSVFSR
jgi:hypothetical protein